MKPFAQMSLQELIAPEGHACACGKRHKAGLRCLRIGTGALESLPRCLFDIGVTKPFVIMDSNTRKAAWHLVEHALDKAGIQHTEYVFTKTHVEPDEHSLGSLVMAFDPGCDGILAVGSGVLNDLAKVFGHAVGLPSAVVATAPSMDGYASDNASMIRNRVKVSLYNACPQAIVADTRVVKEAPIRMLQAGLGDMLAKYQSICEWRIANLVTGEYYCENIAGLVRASLKKIVDNAEGLKNRDEAAIEAVVEGLVLSGIAMSFAEVSRPASGLEHYFSHIWEMMALERGLPVELHGIQVGIGTLLSMQIWDRLKTITPNREKAERFIETFDEKAWEHRVRATFGSAAQAILDTARKEGRNDKAAHKKRLDKTLEHWQDILNIVAEELPLYQKIEGLMKSLDLPLTPADIGFDEKDTRDAFLGAREIRNKYLTSSLLWDLGLLYDFPFPEPAK